MSGDEKLEEGIPDFKIVEKMLNELKDAGKVTHATYELFHKTYSVMHGHFLSFTESGNKLTKKSKALSQLLLSKKIELERATIKKVEADSTFHELMKTKDKCKTDLSEGQERQSTSEYAAMEKKHELKIAERKLQQMKKENQGLMGPKVDVFTKDIDVLDKDLEERKTQLETEQTRKKELEVKQVEVMDALAAAELSKANSKAQLNKIKSDPARIKKQMLIIKKAVAGVQTEIENTQVSITGPSGLDPEITRQIRRKRTIEEAKVALQRKLRVHQRNISNRERELDAVRAKLEAAQAEEIIHREKRVEVEILEKAAEDNMRTKLDRLASINKEFEIKKRSVKSRVKVVDAAAELIPNVELQVTDLEHELEFAKLENVKMRKKIKGLKLEGDMLSIAFVNKLSISEKKKQELLGLIKQKDDLELELEQWRGEDANMSKMIALLAAQREVKARDASIASKNEREAREEVKIKQLVILDLTKKVTEHELRLREFCALYDVVKNERNKYVNLTQSSNQALAEMKEKLKILQSEVEILRNENVTKDRALHKEVVVHSQQCNVRDHLRMEINKSVAVYRDRQESVEQQIVEIDKLNSITNQMENEMLKLKRKYENSVETRNFTGMQLIDRNDELCILYEKSNIQEETLKAGEIALQKLEQSIRMLKLDLAEFNRQIAVTQRSIPDMPAEYAKTDQLERELRDERQISADLCRDLETPANKDRWRMLEGTDPDEDQLQAKIHVLEERMNDKKEQLLEKELVLEEVAALSNKLRSQASEGREDTLHLAKQVNSFQSRIKDITRRMMATVSELSMYQATAIKLQQEKEEREEDMDEAIQRVAKGLAPNEDAEASWYRKHQDSQRRRLQMMQQSDQGVSMTASGKRTTAEQRPNAYVPEGSLGIPKPYGRMAPFRAKTPGSTMRHMRKPKPIDIEI